jgi:hypothetical protein
MSRMGKGTLLDEVILLVLALSVLAVVLALGAPVEAHDARVTVDYPSPGQSTWYYEVYSNGASPSDQVVFQLNLGCTEVVEAGTWADLNTLKPGGGDPLIGYDLTTGIVGIRFEGSSVEPAPAKYYFTLDDNYAEDRVKVVIKAGDQVHTALVSGPSLNCRVLKSTVPSAGQHNETVV